jgi:hypothetical protein
MLDIDLILRELAGERPAFHSEADFQHALAWRIHSKLPETEIRLEVPMALPGGERRLHVDVLVDSTCAIELKYKTKQCEYTVGEEKFVLRNHSAQDFGRYDFLKDIERLEAVILEGPCVVGYAIMLTNDEYYWATNDSHAQDADFRIGDRRIARETLKWADPEREYRKERNKSITLKGEYTLSWKDYSPLGFRRVVAEVSQERLRSL